MANQKIWLAVTAAFAAGLSGESLPGTAPLTGTGDLPLEMVEGIHRFLDRETAEVREKRAAGWQLDFSSRENYARSVEGHRERLRKIVGAQDRRLTFKALDLIATTEAPAQVAQGSTFKVFAVRWPVFPGVHGEGLLLKPDRPPVCRVVAMADADSTPESIAGLDRDADPASQFARRLAESGCEVLAPALIDRRDTWSGIPGIKMTNQPHREWIYRMAYETGRHVIGYEAQKALAAVDYFAQQSPHTPIGVAGYGEGGLIALYSAALDTRIDAALVSGYFEPREMLWREPIYRNVWGLVREFGDAEIAALITPRALVVEASRMPAVSGPPSPTGARNGATPNGAIVTPPVESVRAEVERARVIFGRLGASANLRMESSGPPGSAAALRDFLELMGRKGAEASAKSGALEVRRRIDPSERMHRQFDELVDYTQALIRQSPARRAQFWSKADDSSLRNWQESTGFYRNYLWDEVVGRLPNPSLPANPRTRLIYETPKLKGYEVMLDVWPDVYAYGILLVPKGLKPGEQRPVVVCQHGLESRVQEVADPASDSHYYHRFAAKLTEEGFITYSPQNPYIGQDRFRLILRKAQPLKLSLFSFIVGQHQRTLEWLSSLPFVDSKRIGFYGLSYGGKTAMRVPSLLTQYALSICAGDFNEWIWKNTSLDSEYSYMIRQEYDMMEFDLANVMNYAEMAGLIAPRPFMVERGHRDQVAPDEQVAFEYAKVRRFYDVKLHMPDRTRIEFFDGPHTINGKGTFEFLREFLHWNE